MTPYDRWLTTDPNEDAHHAFEKYMDELEKEMGYVWSDYIEKRGRELYDTGISPFKAAKKIEEEIQEQNEGGEE